MRIHEMFESIQGEGPYSGLPTYFIRTAGCSIGCVWCDTKQAWSKDSGKSMKVKEIVEKVKTEYNNKWVSITGGNPFEQDLNELQDLILKLKRLEYSILIEHPGIFLDKIEEVILLMCTAISIDQKPPSACVKQSNSYNIENHLLDILGACSNMHHISYVKGVYNSIEDINYYLKECTVYKNTYKDSVFYHNEPFQFYLQPCIETVITEKVIELNKYIIKCFKENRFPSYVRLSTQLHKVLNFR